MINDERDPRNLDEDLRQLQVLDPAREAQPDAGRGPAAQAILERVLHESQESPARDAGEFVSRRRGLRWGLAGAAAVAIVAALVILPPWGTPEHAFATWTRAPEPVPVSALDEIATQCSRGSYSAYWEKEALITEERGRVTFVVARSSTMLNHCLLVDGEFAGAGGIRDTSDDEIAADDARLWMAASGGLSMEEDDRYTAITGEVGEDVVGVELHPLEPDREPGGGDGVDLPESVAATVDDGYFGAWWPGETHNVELTIHLADGTTVADIPGFAHDR